MSVNELWPRQAVVKHTYSTVSRVCSCDGWLYFELEWTCEVSTTLYHGRHPLYRIDRRYEWDDRIKLIETLPNPCRSFSYFAAIGDKRWEPVGPPMTGWNHARVWVRTKNWVEPRVTWIDAVWKNIEPTDSTCENVCVSAIVWTRWKPGNMLQCCLHKSDSWQSAIYNLRTGGWSALALRPSVILTNGQLDPRCS